MKHLKSSQGSHDPTAYEMHKYFVCGHNLDYFSLLLGASSHVPIYRTLMANARYEIISVNTAFNTPSGVHLVDQLLQKGPLTAFASSVIDDEKTTDTGMSAAAPRHNMQVFGIPDDIKHAPWSHPDVAYAFIDKILLIFQNSDREISSSVGAARSKSGGLGWNVKTAAQVDSAHVDLQRPTELWSEYNTQDVGCMVTQEAIAAKLDLFRFDDDESLRGKYYNAKRRFNFVENYKERKDYSKLTLNLDYHGWDSPKMKEVISWLRSPQVKNARRQIPGQEGFINSIPSLSDVSYAYDS